MEEKNHERWIWTVINGVLCRYSHWHSQLKPAYLYFGVSFIALVFLWFVAVEPSSKGFLFFSRMGLNAGVVAALCKDKLIVASGFLAVIAFCVREVNVLFVARKKHTFDLVMQSRTATVMQGYRTSIAKDYPHWSEQGPIPLKDWFPSSGSVNEGALALTQMLNYYEFMAVGLRAGDLNMALVKNTMRSMLITLCESTSEHIIHARLTQEMRGVPVTAYCNLLWLRDLWIVEDSLDNRGGVQARVSRLEHDLKKLVISKEPSGNNLGRVRCAKKRP